MNLRNITFTNPAASAPAAPENWHGRRRSRAVSPAREYSLRDGSVEAISDELAACILSRKGFAELSLRGIVIERSDIGRRRYGHPDHPLCNDLGRGEQRRVCYVINPLNPAVAHILSDDGAYLGTLPEIDRPGALDNDALAKERAGKKRQARRAKELLEKLHQPDSDRAMATTARHAEQILKVVQTQPLDGATGERQPPARMVAAMRDAGARHTNALHERRQIQEEVEEAFATPRMRVPSAPAAVAADDLNPFL